VEVSLEGWGAQVTKASSGKKAIEKYMEDLVKKCCRNYFAFVLIDAQMSSLDGFETTIKILEGYETYQLLINDEAPVVVISDNSALLPSEEFLAKVKECGAKGVIGKVDWESGLTKILRAWLGPAKFGQLYIRV